MGKRKKKTSKMEAIIWFVLGGIGLMLLATNIDYYLGDTIVISGIAWNWSTLITIMLSMSLVPIVYFYMKTHIKKIRKK